jgi:hypothetical protein
MKNLVFIAIIVFCLSGCEFKSHKLTKAEAPKAIPAKVITPMFSVEKRAEKYALFFKGRLISSFQYDSINIDGIYPILAKGQEEYVFLEREEKVFGPFAEIKIVDKKTIKISTAGHQKNGFLNTNGEEELFDYYQIDKDPHQKSLYWVGTKSGQKGLLSTGYAVSRDLLVLPISTYFFTDLTTHSSGYGDMSYDVVTIKYFKEKAFGKAYADQDFHSLHNNYSHQVKETKLRDLFGYNAKIIAVNAAKNALVSSEKGYGLINLDGVILVPAAYTSYQKIGDSAYVFSTANEALKVDLNGKKI